MIVPTDTKRPTVSSQVVVQLDYEKQIQKQARKEERKLARAVARLPAMDSSDDDVDPNPASSAGRPIPEANQIHFNKLVKKKVNEVLYPNVYDLQREVSPKYPIYYFLIFYA